MNHDERGRLAGFPGIDRRTFLKAGGVGLGTLGLGGAAPFAIPKATSGRSVILLMLVGGPSQLETWDPKPDAREEIRGPFASIATRTPGVRICEHLPRLASQTDRLAIIRSMQHDQAPIHESGLQLLQTGKLSRIDEHPHFGSQIAVNPSAGADVPPFVIVPGPIGETGVMLPNGQTAGRLGSEFRPIHLDPQESVADSTAPRLKQALNLRSEPSHVRESYGETRFGRNCLLARRLVEAGVKVVVVNMYDTVFQKVSWDCHGSRPFSTFEDYRREVLPTFDWAFSGLIDDLAVRGMLETTLVAAVGEFGRTPRINVSGGRDHWPRVWSAAMAGGGVRGGVVLGASDEEAAEPVDRPVSPGEWLATIQYALRGEAASASPGDEASPLRELID